MLLNISTFLSSLLNMGSANFVEGMALRKDKQECSDDLLYTFIHFLKRVTSYLCHPHCPDAVSSFPTVAWENADVRTTGRDHCFNRKYTVYTCAWTPAGFRVIWPFTALCCDLFSYSQSSMCMCVCVHAYVRPWCGDRQLMDRLSANDCSGRQTLQIHPS